MSRDTEQLRKEKATKMNKKEVIMRLKNVISYVIVTNFLKLQKPQFSICKMSMRTVLTF